MRRRREYWQFRPLRLISVAIFAFAFSGPVFAQALGPFFGIDEYEEEETERPQLLPDNFFDSVPRAALGDIAVEADNLVFDADANMVFATGNVQLSYDGYLATADRAEYDRSSGGLVLIGNAVVRDPDEVIYLGDRIRVTGDFRDAFVNALRMQTQDGALITADQAEYRDQMVALLDNGSYAPCGLCIDEKGNQIGWRVRATKIVLNREEKTLYLEQPTLELVGQPIATLPFYWLPDPTDPRSPGFRLPRTQFNENYGAAVYVPYFYPVGPDTDLWLTPMLMSRQGFLLDAELTHRFERGEAAVRAAGTYQLDRSAFVGEVGDRDWRGAIQVSGDFTPTDEWAAGWSYLAFSDPAFTGDYDLDGFDDINDVYVQHLSDATFFDARIQEFVQTGQATQAQQDRQGRTIPVLQFDHVLELDDDWGRILLSGDLIGVNRLMDHTQTRNGVPYVHGYAGNKFHGTVQAGWDNQFIVPGGVAVTPYLGLRADAASYDGGSALMPFATTLFSATPIAAIDVRFPLIGTDGVSTYLFEPIAQLVYRGNTNSLPGITNDNAQGFVFEDSNLFSFNRFSGSDRQETGLRANIGGQFVANFADGSWLRLIGGQSYHLAGVNAFSVFDHEQVGNGSGLSNTNSYIVAGAAAGFGPMLQVGGKIEIDPATATVARGLAEAELDIHRFTLETNYIYRARQPTRGDKSDTHLVAAEVGVPFADYWTATAGVKYNFVANNWTSLSTSVHYDDEFLRYGASYEAKQNLNTSQIEHFFGVDFLLSTAEDQ